MHRKATISAVSGLLLAVTAPAALARAEVPSDPGAPAIGGITPREPDRKLRVPLAPPAPVQPYVAVSREPGELDTSAPPHRFTRGDLDPTRVDLGTGLRWRLDPRFELFGQYDLLSLRDPAGPADRGPDLVERQGVSGGLSIRF